MKPLASHFTIGNIAIGVVCFIVLFTIASLYVADVGVVSTHAKPPVERSVGKGVVEPMKPPSYVFDDEVVVFETDYGSITFGLFAHEAPNTVANFKRLVREEEYNGAAFYRAEPNFVLQGGLHRKSHKPVQPVKLEYSIPNLPKMVSMARSSNPDSATSEFAIQLKDNSKWLGPGGADSYGYGVFATVIDGWNVVMKIMDLPRTSNPGSATMLSTPVLINKAYIKRTDRYNVNV